MDFMSMLGRSAGVTIIIAIFIILVIVVYWACLYINVGRIIDNQKIEISRTEKLTEEQKKTNILLEKILNKKDKEK